MNAMLIVSVLACGVSPETPPTTATTPDLRPPQAEVVAMLDDAPAEYRYSPIGKRDPFRAFTDAAHLTVVPLAAYRILGVVWGIDEPRALVAGEDGRTFVVSEGSLLGNSWGRVDRISDEGVEVVTAYVTLTGESLEERVVLRLREG